MRTATALWVTLLTSTGLAAEVTPPSPVPSHRLVRVTLAAGERAWVLGADLSPVDLAQTANGLVFTGAPGRYVVLSWTESSQSQTLVVIAGDSPKPTPTPPDPPPTPTPDPVPNDLIDAAGIGLASWRAAQSVGRPAEARTLSSAYLLAASQLHQSQITASAALANVRQARQPLSAGWSAWEQVVESALRQAVDTHGGTRDHWRNYLYEIGKSLEIAGRVSVIRKSPSAAIPTSAAIRQQAECTTGTCP